MTQLKTFAFHLWRLLFPFSYRTDILYTARRRIQSPNRGAKSVQIREITSRQALVKSQISDFALNPYTGCAHNCAYCYASFMARFSRHAEPWGQWVDVKLNVADALGKDLQRLSKKQKMTGQAKGPSLLDVAQDPPEVVISSVTDPYQPLEREYKLTRACLEAIAMSDARLKVSVLTKSALVARDLDILKNLSFVEVGMTVTAADDAITRRYEPGASSASKRLSTLRTLSDAGISTWAFIAPILPYHSDSLPAMTWLLKALKESGVSRIMADRFNPYPASCARFERVAVPEAKEALKKYTARPGEYLTELRSIVAEAAAKVGCKVRVLF